MDSLNLVLRSGVLIVFRLMQAVKNSCCSKKSELHQELRRWIYCTRGMQDKKTRRTGIVCPLLRTTVLVGMEQNKGEVGRRDPEKKDPEIGVQSLYNIQCRWTAEKKSCRGSLAFTSFLSDGCQGLFSASPVSVLSSRLRVFGLLLPANGSS